MLLTDSAVSGDAVAVLPALELLAHRVTLLPRDAGRLRALTPATMVLLDCRTDLSRARAVARTIGLLELEVAVLGVFEEGGLAIVDAEWGLTDVLATSASAVEVDARIRLAGSVSVGRERVGPLRAGDLIVDEQSWSARAGDRPLDLTYKEFELLKHLVRNPGLVLTRDRLLSEVWGMDYYGGTRTVDVHIRRLRAKLGPEREALISTVRNVGYRFRAAEGGASSDGAATG